MKMKQFFEVSERLLQELQASAHLPGFQLTWNIFSPEIKGSKWESVCVFDWKTKRWDLRHEETCKNHGKYAQLECNAAGGTEWERARERERLQHFKEEPTAALCENSNQDEAWYMTKYDKDKAFIFIPYQDTWYIYIYTHIPYISRKIVIFH